MNDTWKRLESGDYTWNGYTISWCFRWGCSGPRAWNFTKDGFSSKGYRTLAEAKLEAKRMEKIREYKL